MFDIFVISVRIPNLRKTLSYGLQRKDKNDKKMNQSRSIISYEVVDMVMNRVQVSSKEDTNIVGKLSIEYIRLYRGS